MDLWQDILLVLLIQLVYVPTFTMRTIFLVRGQSRIASSLGFLESLINVFGLTIILTGDKEPIVLVIYAFGYGLGILLGTYVEKKLAYGYMTMQVNIQENNIIFINKLREEGYGVTVFQGSGRDTVRYKLEILMKRNKQKDLFKLIDQYEPNAFVLAYEPRHFRGGFQTTNMKNKEPMEEKSEDTL